MWYDETIKNMAFQRDKVLGSCMTEDEEEAKMLNAILDELKLNALVITDPYNMRHVSGFRGGEGALYISAAQKVLITDSRYTEQAGKESDFTVIEECRGHNRQTILKECMEKENVSGDFHMGYEDQSMLCCDFDKLRKELPVQTWTPLGSRIDDLRQVKTEEELEYLARAEEIGDKAFAEFLKIVKPGMTELEAAAELEYLMYEAAINAAKSKQGYISQRDIEQSFVKVGIGAEKHSKVISDKEKRITAYHESGHAILFHVLPHESQVHTISIIPTGMGAAGYTMPLPEADEMFMTKKRMEEDIIVAFGGRVAEELIFGDVTTGASQDIKQATATARAMVVKYGMSERLGTINYEDSGEEEVFLGRDLGHARSYSEDVAREIDIEVKRIIDEAYAQAKTIITEHMDVLHRCAQVLIEREKIGNAEFEAIFDGRELPEPGAEQTSLMSGMPSECR